MRPFTFISLVAAATLVMAATPALSGTNETAKFDPARMWECPQADGSTIYTNKERADCKLMVLKELSVVPSLDNMPTYRPPLATTPRHDIPAYADRYPDGTYGGGQHVRDWAKDWYASVASSGSIQAEVCSLYSEWLNLNQKTRGGFFFGSDPSYGGDLSGQNQRGASYSFYDNARYLTLAKMFGPGFVPIGCQ
jgi:hypothetical protein